MGTPEILIDGLFGRTDEAVGVRAAVFGSEGEKLRVVLTDARGRQGVAETDQVSLGLCL